MNTEGRDFEVSLELNALAHDVYLTFVAVAMLIDRTYTAIITCKRI